MKRPLFIIFGTIIIALLLAVWIYILFFSDGDTTDDRFADFDFEDNTVVIDPSQNINNEEPVVTVTGPNRLRQLTTKPTAGYQEVLTSPDTTPAVWYVESGTGHVFSIDLTTGEEKRVSGTTIPLTQSAVITQNGQYVMFQSGLGIGREFIVGTFSTSSESITTGVLAETIIDFTSTIDNTFLYAVQTNNSVVAKEYNPATDTTTTLFTIPFREAVIVWGSEADTIHYAYPKASSKLEGFLYQIKSGTLTRLPIDGFGLTAAGSTSTVLYSKQQDNLYRTQLYDNTSKEHSVSGPMFLADKCVSFNLENGFICGSDYPGNNDHNTLDTWYKGELSYADGVWQIHTDELNTATYLLDITKESGREIDTTDFMINQTDERVYFLNKNDLTLWLFNRISEEMN